VAETEFSAAAVRGGLAAALRTHGFTRTFPRGQALFTEGDLGERVFMIERGWVTLRTHGPEGEEMILALRGPGEIVGEMSMVDRETRSGSVVTLEDCVLFWIDREAFQKCLQTMPKLTLNLTEILSRRLRIANERIKALATLDVHGRIAHHLLVLAQEYGEEAKDGTLIPIRLTQGDLASLVGASRVRVNQALVVLKRRGAISTDQQHHITVHDEDVLARAY
jgi:CRP/FNR family cyclic AMP-dependent transcriptional regulator